MTWRRKLLIVVAIATAIVLIVTTVWKQEIRTAIRDIRYSPTTPAPQTGPHGERFNRVHQRILTRKNAGPIDVLFLGDSITEFWESKGESIWFERFAPLNAGNFGVSTDATQNLLWRITDGGEIDGLSPKVVVLMIGTNNTPTNSGRAIAGGIGKILSTLRAKLPHSRILLLSILPRELDGDVANPRIRDVNVMIGKLADQTWVHYLDVHGRFLDANGQPSRTLLADGLHLSTAGYQTLADAIRPKLDTMLREP